MEDTRRIIGLDGRDLPGFLKKSFTLPFAGGVIWFEHLDGMYEHTGLVLEKLRADTPLFQRPSAPAAIGFVLNETVFTDEIAEQIEKALVKTEKRFMRVTFNGADRKTKKELTKRLSGRGFALGFFEDFEEAKGWLVPKGL